MNIYKYTSRNENDTVALAQNIESEKREYISVYKELFGDKNIIINYSGILVVPIGKFLDSANFGYSKSG